MIALKKWMIVPLLLIVGGLVAAVAKLVLGEHIFGVTDAVPWGILISGYIFFAAVATGTGLVGSLGHVWGIHTFEVLHRRSIFLSAALLVGAFGLIGIDAGNVFHMVYFLFSPNPRSAIWWMVFFYSIYLSLLMLEIYLIHIKRADHPILKPVGYVSSLVKLAAVANLGGVFGWLIARPYWHGIGSSLFLILAAILTGSAVLLISLAVQWLRTGKQAVSKDFDTAYQGLIRVTIAAAVVSLISIGANVWLGLNSSDLERQGAAKLLVSGPLQLRFWGWEILFGLVFPILLLLTKGKSNYLYGALASAFILVGSFVGRLNFVLAGQMSPLIVVEGSLRPEFRPYSVSLPEWALVVAAVSASVLLYHFMEEKYCSTSALGDDV